MLALAGGSILLCSIQFHNLWRVPGFYLAQFDEMPPFLIADKLMLLLGMAIKHQVSVSEAAPAFLLRLPYLVLLKMFIGALLVTLGCFIDERLLLQWSEKQILQERNFREGQGTVMWPNYILDFVSQSILE